MAASRSSTSIERREKCYLAVCARGVIPAPIPDLDNLVRSQNVVEADVVHLAHLKQNEAVLFLLEPFIYGPSSAGTKELYRYYARGSVAIGRCRSLLTQGKAEEAWADCRPPIDTDEVDKLTAIGIVFGTASDSRAHRKTGNLRSLWTRNPSSSSTTWLTGTFNSGLAERVHSRARPCSFGPFCRHYECLYATILYMLREDQEAEKVLTKAHQLRPADPAVNQLLAELHAHAAGGR